MIVISLMPLYSNHLNGHDEQFYHTVNFKSETRTFYNNYLYAVK